MPPRGDGEVDVLEREDAGVEGSPEIRGETQAHAARGFAVEHDGLDAEPGDPAGLRARAGEGGR